MLYIKWLTLTLMSLYILTSVVSNPGCSNKNELISEDYKIFEMKANDVRLRYLNHPLFSFEYPAIFNLIDLNLPPSTEGMGGPTMTGGVSNVDFTYIEPDFITQLMRVRVEKPGFAYNDAREKYEDFISRAKEYADNITIEKVTVYGISADYLEYYRPGSPIAGTIGQKNRISFRAAIFDYSNLIWAITMSWTYTDSEPPEVQGYFNHVIETFKILD